MNDAGFNRDGEPVIEKGPVEARQGFMGRRTLLILGTSLALAAVAYFILHIYFAGTGL